MKTAPTRGIADEQAARLIGHLPLFEGGEAADDAARALIAIIRHFAYQPDWALRDNDAGVFERIIYPPTWHAAAAGEQFAKSADALLEKRPLANDKRSDKVQSKQPDIKDVYARLCSVLTDLFNHPDCPDFVAVKFGEAQTEILNKTSVFTDVSYARHFLPLALAELTEKESADDTNDPD